MKSSRTTTCDMAASCMSCQMQEGAGQNTEGSKTFISGVNDFHGAMSTLPMSSPYSIGTSSTTALDASLLGYVRDPKVLLKRGKLDRAALCAIARCDHLQFVPNLGPSLQVVRELWLRPQYAERYVQLIRDVLLVRKLTQLHAKYPGEYNSHRSRRRWARETHTTFAPSFRDFREWLVHLGPKPESSWTADNISGTPTQGYCPGNVRWASKQTQRVNQRRVRGRHVLPDGRRVTTGELAKLANVPANTVSKRLSRGWPVERILQNSPTYRATWTFPPDLMCFEPEYQKRRNRERGRLDWLIQFLDNKIRSPAFWMYLDEAKLQVFLDLKERLENEWALLDIEEQKRQVALATALVEGARAFLAQPALEARHAR